MKPEVLCNKGLEKLLKFTRKIIPAVGNVFYPGTPVSPQKSHLLFGPHRHHAEWKPVHWEYHNEDAGDIDHVGWGLYQDDKNENS